MCPAILHVAQVRSGRLQTVFADAAICGIGLLFAVKYAPRYGIPWTLGGAAYLGVFLAVRWICRCTPIVRFFQRPRVYFPLLILAAAALALAMLQYHPAVPSNGRAPAINEWLTRLLNGEYPYASPTHPSGFPFLFVLALPFYLVNEVGWLQILTLVAFGLLLFAVRRSTAPEKMAVVLTSPAFLHEVIVRSELISNMIVVVLYLWLFERLRRDRALGRAFLLGLVGGLVLSTRGIVLVVYAVYFICAFRRDARQGLVFALGMFVSFAAAVAPFLVWDAERFLHDGPLPVQASYLSPILVAVTLGFALAWGARVRSSRGIWMGIGFLLLATAMVPFFQAIAGTSWSDAVWQSKFDISYFTFSLPFLLFEVSTHRGPAWRA